MDKIRICRIQISVASLLGKQEILGSKISDDGTEETGGRNSAMGRYFSDASIGTEAIGKNFLIEARWVHHFG